jgi:hypothetical protein
LSSAAQPDPRLVGPVAKPDPTPFKNDLDLTAQLDPITSAAFSTENRKRQHLSTTFLTKKQ